VSLIRVFSKFWQFLAVSRLVLAVKVWFNYSQHFEELTMNNKPELPLRLNQSIAQPVAVTRQLNHNRHVFGWWVLGNSISTGLGIIVGLISASKELTILLHLVLWGIVGTLAGTVQRRILQQQLPLRNWGIVTLAGWLAGGLIAGRGNINWGIIGGMVGAMQWLILKRQLNGSRWWVVANAAGLIWGATFGWSIRFTSRWNFFKQVAAIDGRILDIIDWSIAGIVGGSLMGIITGLWLLWHLPPKRTTAPKSKVQA
jgi:hypothetical protein